MWRVCSPFYSRGSGASFLQGLGSVSPNCHCLACHTGSKGILLSPSEHWVKGLGKSIQRRKEVKQIDMNMSPSSLTCSGSFRYTVKKKKKKKVTVNAFETRLTTACGGARVGVGGWEGGLAFQEV